MRTLWGGDAVEVEAEEGGGIGIEADLGIGRIGGVGQAGVRASETLFVNANVHGLDRAEAGIHEEGDGHGIEKCGRLLAPLVIEKSEGVGERGALTKEERALDLIHFQLSGVEGHDEEGHPRTKKLLGGRNVIEDVPFGLRAFGRTEAEVAVAALDAATHDDDALEISEVGGILVESGTDVHERADGDERDLAMVATNLFEE